MPLRIVCTMHVASRCLPRLRFRTRTVATAHGTRYTVHPYPATGTVVRGTPKFSAENRAKLRKVSK